MAPPASTDPDESSAASSSAARDRAVAAHRSTWGTPELLVRAPGRVNLIGEHTDYNDGFVLPMALPFDTVVAVSGSEDQRTIVRSEGFGELVLGDAASRRPDWGAHIAAMVEIMAADGIAAPPWRATVASDIPAGASLSSSAAIEVAIGLVVAARAGIDVMPERIAAYGQQVESRLLGAPTGIMDQLISATAVLGAASLIDCRTLERTPVAIPGDAAVVVMDTMTRRELVSSEFADRMATCRRAAALLGVGALRDITDDAALEPLRSAHPLEWRRARHVVGENSRTLAAVDALRAGDTTTVGRLMTESHESLRDLFAVSGPALDLIVDLAVGAPGCLGARMTGAGFAGCAVALVRADTVDAFVADVAASHERQTGSAPRLWSCRPAPAAGLDRGTGNADNLPHGQH